MNKFAQIVRYLLALILLVFGSNKFIGFIEVPPYPEGSAAAAYMGGLFMSGYFFPLMGITEVSVGILLAINKYVALALVILAPISLNILIFHLSMDPAGGMVGYIVFLATAFLIYSQKDKYQSLLT